MQEAIQLPSLPCTPQTQKYFLEVWRRCKVGKPLLRPSVVCTVLVQETSTCRPVMYGCRRMVAEEGTYLVSDEQGTQVDKGSYIVLSKKDEGKWQVFRDIVASEITPLVNHEVYSSSVCS